MQFSILAPEYKSCDKVKKCKTKHKENHGWHVEYESSAGIFKQFTHLPYNIWKESKLLFDFCTMHAIFIGDIPLIPKNEINTPAPIEMLQTVRTENSNSVLNNTKIYKMHYTENKISEKQTLLHEQSITKIRQ